HAALHRLRPGTSLQDGRYTIIETLGSGGMGHVYKIRDKRLGIDLALKEMITTLRDRDAKSSMEIFRRETQMLVAGQGHAGVPHIYDSFIEFDRAYIVLDYVEGVTLEAMVKGAAQRGAFLTEAQVGGWMRQLCDIVQYLHSQRLPIIFRDLKPQNVMLTPQNKIMLIDFGIAKYFLSEEEQTNVGTRGYAAPEQYEHRADSRSDIYCIGAMMHHLLTGVDPRQQAPFSFQTRLPRTINPTISSAMEAVIMQCVEYNTDRRYQTALELKTAIDIALGRAVSPRGTGQVFAGYVTASRSARLEDAQRRAPIAETTRAHWIFRAEAPIKSTPTIFDGALYFGSDDNSMRALDARTGQLIWQAATDGPICDKPAIWRDRVIFGSHDFNVYALDARTGAEDWRYRTWQQVNSSPVVYDDHVYIGSNDGYLHAIEPQTGRMIWRAQTYSEVISTPAAAKGTIYFGSRDEHIYAVDALTGESRWKHSADGEVNSSPVVVDDYLYVGSYDHGVYCLEAKSGWRAWCERTGDRIASSPLIVNDRLYIGSVDGALYCLNRRTGQQIWHYTIGRQVNSTPAYANGAIYFGANDGAVYSVDTQTGFVRWRFATDDAVLGSPIIHDNIVYIGSTDGVLYALEANPPTLRGA
ncbi:MAG: serine/threonine-protein kinase, partial [Ktedonobacterales bacterium]